MLYVNDGIFGVLNIMKYEKTVAGPYPLKVIFDYEFNERNNDCNFLCFRNLIDPKSMLFAHCGVRLVTLLIGLEHTLSQT